MLQTMTDIFMAGVLKSLYELFFPRCCSVCGRALSEGEKYLCLSCLLELPRVGNRQGVMDEIQDLFVGSRLVDSAVSYFHYNRQSCYSEIIKDMKYRNSPGAAQWLAVRFAEELREVGFFENLDFIVPVPLHKSKMRKRGYNQSVYVAKGVAAVSGLDVVEALAAVRPHTTQTSKSSEERRRNVAEVFEVVSDVVGKNVLLVDDVITTGATATACCDVLGEAGVQSVKVLSLAFASTM